MADLGPLDHAEGVESMRKLQEIQNELADIKEEQRSKVLEVKRKYNEFRKPLYNRRNQIIQSISGFWITAFLNYPELAAKVSEEDKKIFNYMVLLEVEDFNDKHSGYSITFDFSPNPFFENTRLTKTFSLSDDGMTYVTSTTINWKDGKNLGSGSAQEGKGVKRPITEDSFFSWFDEEQEIFPFDVIDEMAPIIKEIWTDPLNYFRSKVDEEDANEGGSDDDKEDDEKNFNGSDSNDADNDHDDEEDDQKNFNGSDSIDADNDHEDEGKVNDDNDSTKKTKKEIEEQYDDEPDDYKEIEEQTDDDEEEEEAEEEEDD